MQATQLRHRATCDVCGSRLPPRTDAWVDPAGALIVCVSCHATGAWTPPPTRIFDEPVARAPIGERPESDWDPASDDDASTLDPAAATGEEDADGSGSARSDSDSSRRSPVRAGTLTMADGQATVDGLAADLERLRPKGIEVLRGKPWIGSVAADEHVVVAPSGVWVIDVVPTGRGAALERDFLAGTSGAEILNALGGRVTVVGAMIPEGSRLTVPVRGMLCFEADPPDWFTDIFHLAGVTVTDRSQVADQLFNPLVLDLRTRQDIAGVLAGKI